MTTTPATKPEDWATIEDALKQIEKKANKMGALSAGELVLSLAEVIKAMPEKQFQQAVREVGLHRQAREQAAKLAPAVPQQSASDKAIVDAFKTRQKARRQGQGAYVRP